MKKLDDYDTPDENQESGIRELEVTLSDAPGESSGGDEERPPDVVVEN